MTARWINRNIVLLAGAAVLLAACSMEKSSNLTKQRAELVAGEFSQTVDVARFDRESAQALGEYYNHYGEGAVDLIVTYDPSSSKNTAGRATNEAARIVTDLRKGGVKSVTAGILPVNAQGAPSQVQISFSTVKARPPAGCETMGGIDGKETGSNLDYKNGCTIETLVARQIARPADLRGREGLDPANGRRQGNVTENYRTGIANSPLQGELATQQ